VKQNETEMKQKIVGSSNYLPQFHQMQYAVGLS